MNGKRAPYYHPLFFSIYPVLFLFSRNSSELDFQVVVIPLLTSLAVFAGLYAGLKRLLGDGGKAALFLSAFAVFFFTYGPICEATNGILGFSWGKREVGPYKLLLILGALCFPLMYIKLRRSFGSFPGLNKILNVVSLVLILINAGSIAKAEYGKLASGPAGESEIDSGRIGGELPDIYYLILDAYTGEQVLRETFGFDNSAFLDSLRSLGFWIGKDSRSNYANTFLSMTASLNMNYLNTSQPEEFLGQFKRNKVFSRLKSAGYRIVHIPAQFITLDMANTDQTLKYGLFGYFSRELVNQTPLAQIILRFNSMDELNRKIIRFTLNELARVSGQGNPLFVYAHLNIPHSPFSFAADGSPAQGNSFSQEADPGPIHTSHRRAEFIRGYSAQIEFLNRELIKIVREVLAGSSGRAILILQGDHGSRMTLDWKRPENIDYHESFDILNAIYMPDSSVYRVLPAGISPVNTFRFIFDEIFGDNLGLLEDRSYLYHPQKSQEPQEITHRFIAADP